MYNKQQRLVNVGQGQNGVCMVSTFHFNTISVDVCLWDNNITLMVKLSNIMQVFSKDIIENAVTYKDFEGEKMCVVS